MQLMGKKVRILNLKKKKKWMQISKEAQTRQTVMNLKFEEKSRIQLTKTGAKNRNFHWKTLIKVKQQLNRTNTEAHQKPHWFWCWFWFNFRVKNQTNWWNWSNVSRITSFTTFNISRTMCISEWTTNDRESA